MLKVRIKILAWFLGVLFTLIVAIYLVFLIANLHDQPPSAVAQYFESTYSTRVKVTDQTNAFVYALGLSVAQIEDPAAWGEKRFALLLQAQETNDGSANNNSVLNDYAYRDSRSAAIQKLVENFTIPIAQDSFFRFEQNSNQIAEWTVSESWLLQRYLKLLTYRQYQEFAMTDPAMPLPNYAAVVDAEKLFLASLWLKAEQGDVENIKQSLEQDAVYWRMVLASSDMLITKMVATAVLKRHFIIGNLILKKLSQKTSVSALPESWRKPFTKTELSMLQTFNAEWIFQDRTFKKLKHQPDEYFYQAFFNNNLHWLAGLTLRFLQPQEMSNQQADYFKNLVDALDVPLNKYASAADDTAYEYAEEKEAREADVNYFIYNPTGHYLHARDEKEYGQSLYIPYVTRVNDLEGLRQAALVIAEMRDQSLAVEAIPIHLKNSPYQNPYALIPFEWDAESKAIKFTGLEEGERGTYVLAY